MHCNRCYNFLFCILKLNMLMFCDTCYVNVSSHSSTRWCAPIRMTARTVIASSQSSTWLSANAYILESAVKKYRSFPNTISNTERIEYISVLLQTPEEYHLFYTVLTFAHITMNNEAGPSIGRTHRKRYVYMLLVNRYNI